jgi:hypothetical protein
VFTEQEQINKRTDKESALRATNVVQTMKGFISVKKNKWTKIIPKPTVLSIVREVIVSTSENTTFSYTGT